MTEGRDPYKYFRIEARELLEGLALGVLEIEKGAATAELVTRLLRLAHTLKGASRVVKLPAIAEQAHGVEEVLAPHRTNPSFSGREPVDALLARLDAIRKEIIAIEPGREPAPDASAASATRPETFETVRVELREMDRLLEGIRETETRLHALRRDVMQRNDRDLRAAVDQVAVELTQVRERASGLRLLPASTVFAVLERAARDAAHTTQKEIEFRASGGTTRLDAHVLGAVQDALLHVVRNAVAHGVEPAAERKAAGKPGAGRVELTVERRGNRIALACADDGRGIDVAALGRAAVRQGILGAEASSSLTAQDAVRLLLRGGLSTTTTVTELSGRGIGLDVVRATAERLKGEVSVKTQPGRGTRLEIVVPVSLAALPVLVVEASGSGYSVPFDAVRATLRLGQAEVARSGEGESVVYDGKGVPFVPLAALLSSSVSPAARSPSWSVVILQARDSQVALGVDRVRGLATAVVRPLPDYAEIDAMVAGVSLDDEGNPSAVLDPSAVVDAARARRAAPEKALAPAPPILVIDDSLTTRMLEQSILEAEGYEVDLATSAEDALGKAKRRRYGLFLVDVEMPGMDGYQFVAHTQTDPALRDTPSILVTSLASPEHRRRGQDVGARAYIAKGEFDQTVLLRAIRELIG